MSSRDPAWRQLVKSRKFWVTTAVVTSVSLIFYDWYNDRYASPATRYTRIEGDYQISVKKLRKIRKEFVRDMIIGLKEDDALPQSAKKSKLKMLSTNVRSIPTGLEKGIFYTLDWGGSNYRVLRIEFLGKKGSTPICKEYKHTIEQEYQKCNQASTLFNHLAEVLKNQLIAHKSLNSKQPSNQKYPIGFTFSFPITQPKLDQGILLEWTKGFDIPGVVGKDVATLMHESFNKNEINAQIHAVCNDTVGTLLACAYDYDNVRVGLILGTGSNACYIEPNPPNKQDTEKKYDDEEDEQGEIINIEWGNFAKLLPRMPTDFIMDEYTPNPGVQYAEKMISGYYLGELVRLLSLEVFREDITDYAENTPLNFPWKFRSETVSDVLTNYYQDNINGVLDILRGEKGGLTKFEQQDARVFAKICQLIINRSADLSATLLLGTLEKTGLYTCHREDDRNPFEDDRFVLTKEYKNDNNKLLTVGIDGSVYQHVPRYQQRMEECLRKVVGVEIASRIRLVHSSDGSGKGAALAVAAKLSK